MIEPSISVPNDDDDDDWQLKPKYSKKPRPNATLSTTNATKPDLDTNRQFSSSHFTST
jgi:hypothetical protein